MNIKQYLEHVNTLVSPGLIDNAIGWIADGWGCDSELVEPEQIAAALFMEANTQDQCVKEGVSHPDFPWTLRFIAYKILEIQGHAKVLEEKPSYGMPSMAAEILSCADENGIINAGGELVRRDCLDLVKAGLLVRLSYDQFSLPEGG